MTLRSSDVSPELLARLGLSEENRPGDIEAIRAAGPKQKRPAVLAEEVRALLWAAEDLLRDGLRGVYGPEVAKLGAAIAAARAKGLG